MTLAKVTVIVAVYNVERYIEQCVRSLFEQTLKEIEYVFVDDGSTDRSMEIFERVMEEYPERRVGVKVVRQKDNRGVAAARNAGLALATGEYIIHADGDDWVEKEMYERLYRLAQESEADIVGCDYFNEYGERQVRVFQSYADEGKENIRRILSDELRPYLWCHLVSRKLYTTHGLCFEEKVNVGEDLWLLLRAYAFARRVGGCRCAFYHYRRTNPGSYCNRRGREAIEDDLRVAELAEDFLRRHYAGQFEQELAYRKFMAKYALWSDRAWRDYKRWRALYPEAHVYLWKYKRLDWKVKTECWLAFKGFPRLADGFVTFLHWQRQIRDRRRR